jgi:hypothetical protein
MCIPIRRGTEVPAVREVQIGDLDELALGADAFEEHDQLELEEDDRVNGRATPLAGHLNIPQEVA